MDSNDKKRRPKLKGCERDQAVAQYLSQIPKDTLPFLNNNSIFADFRGGKPSMFCQACRCPIKTVAQAEQHASTPSHKDAVTANRTIHLLEHLPPITVAHKMALNQVLNQASEDVFISPVELERRRVFSKSVCIALEARIPGLKMRVIGSVMTGFSFQDSDVNLDACIDAVNGIAKDCRLSYNQIAASVNSNSSTESPASVVKPENEKSMSGIFVDPYKPGFGPHLIEILEVLRPIVTKNNETKPIVPVNDDLPPFPHMHQLIQCNVDNFNLTFKDSEGVNYRITVGNPNGIHFANLVNAYLSINSRALQLAILVRKLAKMASIDLPDMHTFQPPALLILVIFYLQHTSPPILPNLHEIARRSDIPEEAIEYVISSEENCSFLKDLTLLPRFFTTSNSLDSNDDVLVNRDTIADLWLGFLRFYRFEFQSRTCKVCITQSNPVAKTSRQSYSSYLWVEDPFCSILSLTHNLMPNTNDYIQAQFAAAYAYFGVPRLVSNGRHLFTNVELQTPKSSVDGHEEETSERIKSKYPKPKTPTCCVCIKSTMDTADDFGEHITKVTGMFAFEFSSLAGQNMQDEDVQNPALHASSITNNTLELMDLMPIVLRLSFGEIVDKEFLENLVHASLKKIRINCRDLPGIYTELGLTDATGFIRCFCISLWRQMFKVYVHDGNFTATEKRLSRIAQNVFRSIVKVFRSVRNVQSYYGKRDGKARKSVPTLSKVQEKTVVSVANLQDEPHPMSNEEDEEDGAGDADSSVDKTFTSEDFIEEDEEEQRTIDEQKEEDEQLTTDELLFLGDTDDEVHAIDANTEDMDVDMKTLVDDTTLMNKPKENSSNKKPKDQWRLYIKRHGSDLAIIDSSQRDFYQSELANSLRVEDYSFPFLARGHVTQGKMTVRSSVLGLAFPDQPSTLLAHFRPPAQICSLCGTRGHRSDCCTSSPHETVGIDSWRQLKSSCPPCTNNEHLTELSNCLIELSDFNTCEENNKFRKFFVDKLNKLFQNQFPSVQLELFGSCANGFETKESDMDICVFFPPASNEAKTLSDPKTRIQCIKSFMNMLSVGARNLGISNMRPVLQAKVPIIKFLVQNRFEVDLSFSNYLAISNTRMLRIYNQINPNLRVLNIALKAVIKSYKIAKADAGGISSYAFGIMLIYFMQQRGYLPILQELYEGSDRPIIKAGTWNIWFQDDLSVINKLWILKKNVSVGEIWLDFFRFYLFEFDRERYVVTINQKMPLERLAKLWNSLLAVEDPFNLRHNLTAAVQRKVLTHVLNTFYIIMQHHSNCVRGDQDINIWKYSLFSFQKVSVVKGNKLLSEDQNVGQRKWRRGRREGTNVESRPSMANIQGPRPMGQFMRPVFPRQPLRPQLHAHPISRPQIQGMWPSRDIDQNHHPQVHHDSNGHQNLEPHSGQNNQHKARFAGPRYASRGFNGGGFQQLNQKSQQPQQHYNSQPLYGQTLNRPFRPISLISGGQALSSPQQQQPPFADPSILNIRQQQGGSSRGDGGIHNRGRGRGGFYR